MIEAHLVPVQAVDQIWPLIADDMVQSGKRTHGFDAGYLWMECRAGRALLVTAHRGDVTDILGAAVVRFEKDGERPVLRGMGLCGRNMKEWQPAMGKTLNQIAKEGGAEVFIDEGRPGLAKRIKGARVVRVIFEVDVK